MFDYKKSLLYQSEEKEIKDKLVTAGLSVEQAGIVADCFATADAFGVNTHGISVLPSHINRMERGGYNLNPNFSVIRQTPAFAVIDGDNAIGPVSAVFCLNYGINNCKNSGVYTVFSRNNNTFGPAFYYSLKAAEQGYIAFICSNSPAQMAPVGGKDKLIGTNPFSMVIPVPGHEPVIVDMATSVVAKSKFKEYKNLGKQLPDHWALDENGNPTNDPDTAMAGLILPMAGFKGYAIAMLIDIVSGILSGASYLNRVGRFYSENCKSMNVGFYLNVIDPHAVCGEDYDKEIAEYISIIRNSTAIAGQTICLPGDDRIKHKNDCFAEVIIGNE